MAYSLLDTYMCVSQGLAMTQRDLPHYLLSFFASFEFRATSMTASEGLTYKLASILLAEGLTEQMFGVVRFMLQNAYPILNTWIIFQSAYVTKAAMEQDANSFAGTTWQEPREQYATAIQNCSMVKKGYLCFKAGDKIRVISTSGNLHGWWIGAFGGKEGVFPPGYVTQNKALASRAHELGRHGAIGQMLRRHTDNGFLSGNSGMNTKARSSSGGTRQISPPEISSTLLQFLQKRTRFRNKLKTGMKI
jgi:hypothetical protein